MTPSELFAQVVTLAPTFRLLVREHLRDNDELLPHLLMSDLLRYIGSHFSGNAYMDALPPNPEQIRAILALLDSEIACHNADTENLIAVSFIEHIEMEPFFLQLRPYLGPALLAELTRQNAWHGAA